MRNNKYFAILFLLLFVAGISGCDTATNTTSDTTDQLSATPTTAGEWTALTASGDETPIITPITPPPDLNYSADNITYTSNGDLIAGWHWVRDRNLDDYARWTITGLPSGLSELVLDMEVLATNTVSGDRGYDAYFELDYCSQADEDSSSDNLRDELKSPLPEGACHQSVHLPNVSADSDPVGYTCRGQVTIPGSAILDGGTLVLTATRADSSDNHVAFKKESIANYLSGGGNDNLNTDETLTDETELTIAQLDSDGDGIIDADEVNAGLDPNNVDTDGDGVTDNKDLSGAIDPVEPGGWLDNQKKGMIRQETAMLAWGMDGWVEQYQKRYSIIPPRSWLEYLGTKEEEGTKKSTMTEEYYKKAVDLAFGADNFIAYEFNDISPSDIAVDDVEKTNDHDHEHDYTFQAGLFHPNEYRFYYDDITDYTTVKIKNDEEIKYPNDEDYFQYLLMPVKIDSGRENIFKLQFVDSSLYNAFYYESDTDYMQPGFIYTFYPHNNFDDDSMEPLQDDLAVSWLVDNGVFEVALTLPLDRATTGSGYLKLTPVMIKKDGNSTDYLPTTVDWNLTGLSRSSTYVNDGQGNVKVLTQELDSMDMLNNDWPSESYLRGQSGGTNYHETSNWYGVINKDPEADHPYSGYEATRTVINWVNTGLSVDNTIISLNESIELSNFKDIDDIGDLPGDHWARQPKYSRAVGAFALAAGVVSIASDSMDAYVAIKNGEMVDVAYYSARIAVTGVSTAATMVGIATRTAGYTGKATKFAKLGGTKAAVGLAAAAGAVELIYDSYKLYNADDPIETKAYKEKIAADVVDTGLSIASVVSPHVLAFQITWTVEVEIYGAIFGEDFAYKVASSPGGAAMFLADYFFTGDINSNMSTPAYEDARDEILENIELHYAGVGLPYMTIFIDPDLE